MEELAKKIRFKLAEDTLTESANLEDIVEKTSSIDLPEESLAANKMTESWVNKTTKEVHSAHKTEPSPSAAGLKPLCVNPVNQFFQPAISVSTSQLDEGKNQYQKVFVTQIWKKNIIQINTQYIPKVSQTSKKSTVLPVGFIQTAQTRQSQTLALPPSKESQN